MRLASHLCTSRHGIFYFRLPVPTDRHPTGRRGHIKLSLQTREPREARHLSRLFALAGQSLLARPMVRAMRYDEMRQHVREHFGQMLHDFRERSAATGPASGAGLDALRAAQGLVEGAPDDWATLTHPEGADGLLRAFCAARGIAPDLDTRQRALLLSELQKGQREYVEKALTLTAEFETLPLEEPPRPEVSQPVKAVSSVQPQADALPFAEVLSRYFTEIERTKALAAKTAGEKQDALALIVNRR